MFFMSVPCCGNSVHYAGQYSTCIELNEFKKTGYYNIKDCIRIWAGHWVIVFVYIMWYQHCGDCTTEGPVFPGSLCTVLWVVSCWGRPPWGQCLCVTLWRLSLRETELNQVQSVMHSMGWMLPNTEASQEVGGLPLNLPPSSCLHQGRYVYTDNSFSPALLMFTCDASSLYILSILTLWIKDTKSVVPVPLPVGLISCFQAASIAGWVKIRTHCLDQDLVLSCLQGRLIDESTVCPWWCCLSTVPGTALRHKHLITGQGE